MSVDLRAKAENFKPVHRNYTQHVEWRRVWCSLVN